MAPAGVTRPMALAPPVSANHTLPSGAATIAPGLPPDGTGNSVMVPVGVMRPILRVSFSVNQTLPSGPLTIPHALLAFVGMAHSVNVPVGVIRPILLPVLFCSVNQRLPSGPAVIPAESRPPGTPRSVIWPLGAAKPTPCCFVYQTFPSGPAA